MKLKTVITNPPHTDFNCRLSVLTLGNANVCCNRSDNFFLLALCLQFVINIIIYSCVKYSTAVKVCWHQLKCKAETSRLRWDVKYPYASSFCRTCMHHGALAPIMVLFSVRMTVHVLGWGAIHISGRGYEQAGSHWSHDSFMGRKAKMLQEQEKDTPKM